MHYLFSFFILFVFYHCFFYLANGKTYISHTLVLLYFFVFIKGLVLSFELSIHEQCVVT